MSFPNVALRIDLPTTANDFLNLLSNKGIEKFTETTHIPLSRLGSRIQTIGDYFGKVDGWYEMQGLSFASSVPTLKKLKPNKEIYSPINLVGETEFDCTDVNNFFYSMNFRAPHNYRLKVYSQSVNPKGEILKHLIAEDALVVDFSHPLFFMPTPKIRGAYQFENVSTGGLIIRAGKL